MRPRRPVIQETVLCFVLDRQGGRLLMIRKKRGQGAGKVNVPGGKRMPHELPSEAAIRETEEETGIRPGNPIEAGRLEFYFPESQSWDNHCTVFVAEAFSGRLVPETDECTAYWEDIDRIPFDLMWQSDRLWVPLVLAGKPFHRAYVFDASDGVREERNLDAP